MNKELYDKLIFEYSRPGRVGVSLPQEQYPESLQSLPADLLRRNELQLPEVDEPTVVRHYTNQSTNNFGVDTGFYPLGSCTMKYNPKINEELAADRTVSRIHPLQPASTAQGVLEIYWQLQRALSEIGGMSEFTLNPFAGAHGELTGLLTIRASRFSRRCSSSQSHCSQLSSRYKPRQCCRCRIYYR
jgi:glycine dehydrogenase subunit 2